jgi:hypothetical protein
MKERLIDWLMLSVVNMTFIEDNIPDSADYIPYYLSMQFCMVSVV